MISQSVVIDNDALVNLFELNKKLGGIFDLLQSLFFQIHIPLEVKNEFLNSPDSGRTKFIEKLKLNQGFICICDKYDTISLMLLKTSKGIDSGECEVAAQKMKLGVEFIVSDDARFVKGLEKYDPYQKIYSTLHLMALIDLHQLYNDTALLKRMLYQISPFNQEKLKDAYLKIAETLGLRLGPKRLKDYTSFKKIGIS